MKKMAILTISAILGIFLLVGNNEGNSPGLNKGNKSKVSAFDPSYKAYPTGGIFSASDLYVPRDKSQDPRSNKVSEVASETSTVSKKKKTKLKKNKALAKKKKNPKKKKKKKKVEDDKTEDEETTAVADKKEKSEQKDNFTSAPPVLSKVANQNDITNSKRDWYSYLSQNLSEDSINEFLAALSSGEIEESEFYLVIDKLIATNEDRKIFTAIFLLEKRPGASSISRLLNITNDTELNSELQVEARFAMEDYKSFSLLKFLVSALGQGSSETQTYASELIKDFTISNLNIQRSRGGNSSSNLNESQQQFFSDIGISLAKYSYRGRGGNGATELQSNVMATIGAINSVIPALIDSRNNIARNGN
ncbi:MAG: hypothetical protein AB8E15_08065 [Bdellovibrionales bacterium]